MLNMINVTPAKHQRAKTQVPQNHLSSLKADMANRGAAFDPHFYLDEHI